MGSIRSLLSVITLLVCLSFVQASDVVTLTKDNFEATIAKEPLVFVKFFAPWCGHCKAMADDFKSAATELKGKAILADVDATVEEDLAKKYNIQGFPTLKVFADGEELTDYNGGRDKESMIKFMQRATLPPFTTINDKKDYDSFIKKNEEKNILVGMNLDEKLLGSFKKATFSLRDIMPEKIEFIHSTTNKITNENIKDGDIYLLKVDTEGKYKTIKYNGENDQSIDAFVKKSALPAFQELTQANAELYTEMTNPLVIGFYEDCTNDECQLLEKLANKYSDVSNLAFAWVNKVTLQSFMEYVGLKDAEIKIFAYSFTEDSRFMLPEDFKLSEENLSKWIEDLKDGKIERARKSQPVPTSQEDAIYQIVGDTWEEEVEKVKKDVLIAQVAEWCGHCKALKPILKKVAEELTNAGIDHIRIAQMDATENDAPPSYKAKGFPTVHFFKDGVDTGIEFDGDRTGKGIIEWLKENSSKKFEFDVESLGEDPTPEEEEEEEDMEGDEDDDEEGEDDEDDDGGDDGVDGEDYGDEDVDMINEEEEEDEGEGKEEL